MVTVSSDYSYIPVAWNKQSYYIHSNCVYSLETHDSLLVTLVGISDFFAKTPFAVLKLQSLECTNQEDWNVVYCTLQRNLIEENRSGKMVGNGIDNVEHYDGKLLSVHGNIHVVKDTQLIAEFELVEVYIGWHEIVVSSADNSDMKELNNEVVKILPVQLSNVEHGVRHYLQQVLNVCTIRLELLVAHDVNRYFVACMVMMVVNEHTHERFEVAPS